MSSSVINYGVDDKDLDDDALWAVIDSIADAAAAASKYRNISQAHKHTPIRPILNPSNKLPQNPRTFHNDGEVSNYRRQKISRSNTMSPNSSIANQRSPAVTNYSSPEFNHSYNNSPIGSECSPATTFVSSGDGGIIRHSLAGPFPTVSLFKDYQNAAMAILERGDYTMISGSLFIKKTGWRKISFYFNLSYEIKDKTIEFDENRNVLRAEFIVRAHMQGARFSDGWGSCERREKKFLKPNHDIPSTAETRAKNKACQDLLGIGEYRPGVSQCRTSNS